MHTIREGVRMKVALVLLIVLLVALPFFAFTVSGDGVTLLSRVQMFMSFSLTATSALLGLLTVFLACGALSEEVRTKNIHMVAVKPIPRWQFVLGKWLGIAGLNAALLGACGLFIYGGTWYLGNRLPVRTPGKYTEEDLSRVQNEIFSTRVGVPLRAPDFSSEIEDRLRQKRTENSLTIRDENDLRRIRAEIEMDLKREYLTIGPRGGAQVYLFKDLHVNREPGHMLHVRYKGAQNQAPQDYIWRLIWLAGDPSEGTEVVQIRRSDQSDRYNTLDIPTTCVSDDGILRLEIHNLDPGGASLSFGDMECGLELLFRIGGFGWNLTRGLILLYFHLLFFAALGLVMSSFVSFPIACLFCLIAFFMAIGGSFLEDAISWESIDYKDPLWWLVAVFRAIAQLFAWLLPNLSKLDPIPTIVDGRLVTLMWLIVGLVDLVIVRGLILGFLACVIFSRRELAQVTV